MARGGLGDWGFPQKARRRIQFVRRAKELGFTTREAGKLLSLGVETPPDRAAVKELVDSKIADLDEKLRRLRTVRSRLAELSKACGRQTTTATCPVLEVLG